MLSQTSEYALRAALHLAERGEGPPIRVDEIAQELQMPRNYLSKILHTLGREGLLDSTRGPRGGFELAIPAHELTLDLIIEPFDPGLLAAESRCILGQEECSDRDPCLAHARWKSVSSQVQSFFRTTTLAQLLARRGGDDASLTLKGMKSGNAG